MAPVRPTPHDFPEPLSRAVVVVTAGTRAYDIILEYRTSAHTSTSNLDGLAVVCC